MAFPYFSGSQGERSIIGSTHLAMHIPQLVGPRETDGIMRLKAQAYDQGVFETAAGLSTPLMPWG